MPKKITIQDMHSLAASRGGRFLSPEYLGAKYHHQWECEEGHKFSAVPGNVSRGTWCSVCSGRISERLCRAIFESIFGAAFPSRRPDWLRNAKGHRLELDGYCEKLGVAFEYQGLQHFERVPYFHRSEAQFQARQANDARKREVCARRGVALIVVPYWVELDALPEYVVKESRKRRLPMIEDWHDSQLDLSKAYSPRLLEQLSEPNRGQSLTSATRTRK